ncbi:hypothetical protein VTJ04DRAFT_85 [Mycothermus thermophilus]|uniref:uncharacterized protein n=1 Tax=Humicola insolens TaxID=85995 RepID=UPI003742A268
MPEMPETPSSLAIIAACFSLVSNRRSRIPPHPVMNIRPFYTHVGEPATLHPAIYYAHPIRGQPLHVSFHFPFLSPPFSMYKPIH